VIRSSSHGIIPHTMGDDSTTGDLDRARAAAEQLVEERG